MKTKTRLWLRSVASAFITGSAGAIGSFLGVSVAHEAGVDVPTLNLQALGIIALSSGLVGAAAYLRQSPLPPADDEAEVPISNRPNPNQPL